MGTSYRIEQNGEGNKEHGTPERLVPPRSSAGVRAIRLGSLVWF